MEVSSLLFLFLPMKNQNYGNHTRYDPFNHFFLTPLILLFLGWTVSKMDFSSQEATLDSLLLFIGAFILFLLPLLVRSYALKLQNRIKNSFDKEDNIYIYGKHGHAEVIGLLGQTNNKAVVFQDISELDIPNLPKNITLYSQTTKSTDKFYEINEILRENGITVNTNDTICRG